MRTTILSLILMFALCAPAQQPPLPAEGSNWQHVQALPTGASIRVNARSSHQNCTLKSVDADTLTCTRGKDFIFQRSEIITIKLPHRGRSALIGTAIGGGVGAGIGFAAGSTSSNGFFGPNFLRGAVTAVGAVLGGAAGAATGGLSDFSQSTVYRAP